MSIAVALLILPCPSAAERQVFLATWKDIPNENELQYQIKECHLTAGRLLSSQVVVLVAESFPFFSFFSRGNQCQLSN